jgi:hypothetical protein
MKRKRQSLQGNSKNTSVTKNTSASVCAGTPSADLEPKPEVASIAPAIPCRGNHFIAHVVIVFVTIFCHWFLLTNDGLVSDGWWLMNFIKTKNWLALHDNYGGAGMPIIVWAYRPFALLEQPVSWFMSLSVAAFVISGIITYHLGWTLGGLSERESLLLTLLAQALPLYSNAQEFITFPFIAAHTLFLGSVLMFVTSFKREGGARLLLRVFGCLGFYLSLGYAALLVFYGFFYLLLMLYYKRDLNCSLASGAKRFIVCYPELFLLPPCTWVIRSLMNPNNWWLENYNSPGANIKSLIPNLLSFYKNVLPYHLNRFIGWPVNHPGWTIAIGAFLCLIIRLSPEKWAVKRSSISSPTLFLAGTVALFLSIFGFGAAGKYFPETPTGTSSSYCMFAGLPCSILVFSLLRSSLLLKATRGLVLPIITAFLVIISGCEFYSVYLKERIEFIFSRALLHNAHNNQDIRKSSVLLLQNFTAVKQPSYGTYAFASEFGELSRFVSAVGPENKQFYTPSELSRMMKLTTFPPDDFRHVNPAGQQLYVEGTRHQEGRTDWQLAYEYFKARFFGTKEELHSFLEPLVTLKTTIIRSAMPFAAGEGPFNIETRAMGNSIPDSDFVATEGIQMVRLPDGWWVSRYETTQQQYEGVMGTNPSLFKAPHHPVESVSWYEAMEFCKRLTSLEKTAGRLPTGMVYRLPTIQEYDSLLPDGPPLNPVLSVNHLRWQTSPVGSAKAGKLGLHDLVGNVWEWCLDWSDSKHRFKISKGGSWNNFPWETVPYAGTLDKDASTSTRAAIKILVGPNRKDFPNSRFWEHGFRCILAPAKAEPDAPPPSP